MIRASFDPEFRKKWLATIRQAKADVHESYEPTECIKPGCANLVAPISIKPREGHHKNYRGTGACKAGHNSFYCTECKTPHSHRSKVGKAHYKEHNGGDWTAEKKKEVDWK